MGKGRQLVSASGGGKSISYTYDMAGIRNSKTVGDITYHYDTLNGKVVRQTWTENGKEHVFDIVYDASGLPYACVYNGSRYYYILNQQGDVIRIVGYLGATLCEYQYDAWGNVLAITGTYRNTIGKINPIRYRGYYYDTETGFYYLQSRYYDPSIGRFINADQFTTTGQGFLGCNMFAYCGNSPILRADTDGDIWHIAVAAMIGAAANVACTIVGNLLDDEEDYTAWNDGLFSAALTGAITGGLSVTPCKPLARIAINVAVTAYEGFDNVKKAFQDGEYVLESVVEYTLSIGASAITSNTAGLEYNAATRLGKQTLKRTGNALWYDGIGACFSEIGKAGSWYWKNAKTFISTYSKQQLIDSLVSVGDELLKGILT